MDVEGCTPLAYAACRGREDMVRTLLRWGMDLEARNFFGNAILMHAVTSRDVALVGFILKEVDRVQTSKAAFINHQVGFFEDEVYSRV